jgi:hypothetical protein
MLSSAEFEANVDVDIDKCTTHFQLLAESVITHYQIQLKVTYQPQGNKKCGHAHKEWRNGFEFWELELESHFYGWGVGGCGVGQEVEVRASGWMWQRG